MNKPEWLFFTMIDAIEAGDLEWVQARIAAGADVRGVLSTGQTALHKAAAKGSPEIVRFFLDAGVDVHAVDKEGGNALNIAATRRDAGGTQICKLLIEAGANVNLPKYRLHCPLHYAVHACNTETVKLLIDAGADVNAVTSNGMTPLLIAAKEKESGQVDAVARICRLLLQAGADSTFVPKHADKEYLTPFQCAVQQGFALAEVVRDMFELGHENPSQKTVGGRSLFNLAPSWDIEMQEMLRAMKTEYQVRTALQDKTKDGATPAKPAARGPGML